MSRIAGFIVAHSKRILIATALITLIAVVMLFRVQFNADVSSFLLEGNERGEEFAALQEKYDAADPINVVVSLPDGQTFADPDALARLTELRDRLSAVPGVSAVASVVPDTVPQLGVAVTPELIAAAPPELVGQLLASPVTALLLSESGQHTLLMLTPEGDRVAVARAADDVVAPDGFELTFSGNPVVFARVLDVLSLFILLIPPVVIGLLVLVFYATIGDRRLSALAIVPAALGSLWTFGLIFGLGREIDIVTVIVPIFVVVMGSADGLHFVTHFQDAAADPDPVERVRSALSHVGIPMILTTVSTAVGFLSLLATDVEPIRQLGLFTAVGITFAGIISFFFLPAILSRLHIDDRHHEAILGPKITSGMKALVRTRVPAGVLTGVLLAFALVFVPRLEVNPDQLFFFKDDDPVRVAFNTTEELFGGATPLLGEFVFDPASDPVGQLAQIDAVSAELEAQPGVRKVFSLADVAAAGQTELAAAAIAGDLELPVGAMVSSDGLRFMLLPADFSTEDLQGWLTFAETTPEIRTLTGMPVVWDEIARLVLQAQIVSVIIAFVLVVVMLWVTYRNLWHTLVALVPIVLTVLTLLGFIAASGIQLNLLTAVISSIVIGVGIDYSIHFVAAIDYARPDGPGYVLRAIDRAGRPIVANALGIALGLTALWLSPLRIHGQVSVIMWVAMLTAASTALIVIPALLPRDGVQSQRT